MEQKELLISLFTRYNPNADTWVYQGFGPMRRTVKYNNAKDNKGKWNFVSLSERSHIDHMRMPNPDTLLETLILPLEDTSLDLVEKAKKTEKGLEWISACEEYLEDWEQTMPNEISFEVKLFSNWPSCGLYYVEKKGAYFGICSKDDIWKMDSLHHDMVYGTFRPTQRTKPWIKKGGGQIGMMCNGGVITSKNQRWGYILQPTQEEIYLTSPFSHQLIGDMQKRPKNANSVSSGSNFPRTHFIEYVFSTYCQDEEKNPCPGIRIELKPDDMSNTTLAREQEWSKRQKDEDDAIWCVNHGM